MPNWVKCDLFMFDASAERKNEVTEFVKGTEKDGSVNVFSLNQIIPMPEDLHMNKSAALYDANKMDEYKQVRDKEEADNMTKYGYKDWYDWRLDKWGCKWDTTDAKEIVNGWDGWTFQTPWSIPGSALLELSKKFPDITFRLEYADEDMGYNCGIKVFKNGTHGDLEDFEQGTSKAIEHALEIWDCADDYYYDADLDEWIYKDEENLDN